MDSAPLQLSDSADRVVVGNRFHRLLLAPDRGGVWRLSGEVRQGKDWKQWFAPGPLPVRGPGFDLAPAVRPTAEDRPRRKTVRLKGRHPVHGAAWEAVLIADAGSAFLDIEVTVHATTAIELAAGEPSVRVALLGDGPATAVGQGPMSIYGAPDYGAAFPAAYAWRGGIEALVFLDPTPMEWFGRSTRRRFLDGRVAAQVADGRVDLGLVFPNSGPGRVEAGPLRFAVRLHAAARPRRPTALDAQVRMVEICAPFHPGPTAIPKTRVAPFQSSWETYAQRTVDGLSVRDRTLFERGRNWVDAPLALVPPVARIMTHPDRVGNTGADFSTTNNHLTPWLLHARLHPGDRTARETAVRKLHALPAFFDTGAGFLCWSPDGHGPLAMAWQTFWFPIEALRASDAADDKAFSPAVAGRVLMGLRGLRAMVRGSDGNLPQWWDVDKRAPAIQNDLPELGVIREPWQVGQYAYLLTRAAERVGEPALAAEAGEALSFVTDRLRFSVKNDRYAATFDDPAAFPVTELFGVSYGSVAARMLYRRTRDPRFARMARQLLAILLRLTPWYEDNATEVGRELSSIGLFYPHGGAYNLTPWETNEATLCLAWWIANVPEEPLRPLLLRLADCHRVHGFHFFPATWSDTVLRHARRPENDAGPYFPVEPFHTLEGPGGHTGATALYKPTALWNSWLFEALAVCDDPGWMALNTASLDGHAAAVEGVSRTIVVTRGNGGGRARLTLRRLPDHPVEVRVDGRSAKAQSGPDSTATLELTMKEGESRVVTVQAPEPVRAAFARRAAARDALSATYQKLQERGSADRGELDAFRAAWDRVRG